MPQKSTISLPTVLANCQPGTPAYDDELFGPVASVIKASDDADAMRIANDSRCGLRGGIFTKDEDKAIELARNHFDTETIRINSFDGVKNSGCGREYGCFGMKEFVNARTIARAYLLCDRTTRRGGCQ